MLLNCRCLIFAALCLAFSEAAKDSSCLATAIENGRKLFETQEAFYKCFRECTKPILKGPSGKTSTMPDFTANLNTLVKSAGMSLCSKKCFGEVESKSFPASTTAYPWGVYEKIAKEFAVCSVKDRIDPIFVAELAKFNMDNVFKKVPFTDPKLGRLFSIFNPEHMQSLWSGVQVYDETNRNCKEVIMTMESALTSYMNGVTLCQYWCLTGLAYSTDSDGFTILSNISDCQHNCFYLFRTDPAPEKSLLHPASEIHHYLQYCLWHTGSYAEAYSHAASYTILEPEDSVVYDYYVGGGKIAAHEFIPSPDGAHLKQQYDALVGIIKMIRDVKAGLIDALPGQLGRLLVALNTGDIVSMDDVEMEEEVKSADGYCDASSGMCESDVSGIMKAMVMVGNFTGYDNHRRYVVDNALTYEQCMDLVGLNAIAGTNGDGFLDTKRSGSPYTDHESYVGLSAHMLAKLAGQGSISPELVLLYFKTAQSVLEKTKELYNLPELYFYFTHLVCREAIPPTKGETMPERDNDLSHPVHADNCGIMPNGDCIYTDPKLLPRNYSSVLYLNDDFEGGEFFFTKRPSKEVERTITPRCGRFVSFHASEFHGVKAVTKVKKKNHFFLKFII